MTKLEEFRDTYHLSGIDGTRGIEETLRALVKLVRERSEEKQERGRRDGMMFNYTVEAFNEIVSELRLDEP